MSHALQTLEKYAAESRLYTFGFGAKMSYGETIASYELTVSAGAEEAEGDLELDVSDEDAVGQNYQVRLGGGQAGTKYKLVVVVETSLGNTLVLEGYLTVK